MKPEIKEKFIAALRSGEYNQTTARLYRKVKGEDCYCALGVLCDLALKEGVEGLVFDPTDDEQLYFFRGPEPDDAIGFGWRISILPTVVKQWADVDDFFASRVYSRNDSGRSFHDLAKWVEKNF